MEKTIEQIDAEIALLEDQKRQLQREKEAKRTPYDRYLDTYNGRKLLEKHSLSEYGVWQIKGEDPNCDMGGIHYQPDLGYVEGTLEKVIRHAVELSNFWQWGGGGDITRASDRLIKKL